MRVEADVFRFVAHVVPAAVDAKGSGGNGQEEEVEQ